MLYLINFPLREYIEICNHLSVMQSDSRRGTALTFSEEVGILSFIRAI
jgi:hypothetical protein